MMAPETPGPSTWGRGSTDTGAPPQRLVGSRHQHAFGQGGILTPLPWRPAGLTTGRAAKGPPGAQLSPALSQLCRREEQGRGRALRRNLNPGSSAHPSSGGRQGRPRRPQTQGQDRCRSRRRSNSFMPEAESGFQTSVTNHTWSPTTLTVSREPLASCWGQCLGRLGVSAGLNLPVGSLQGGRVSGKPLQGGPVPAVPLQPLILGLWTGMGVWQGGSWAVLGASLAWPATLTRPRDVPSSLLEPLSPLTLPSRTPGSDQPPWPPLSSPGTHCLLPSPCSCHWGQSNFIKLDVVKLDNFAKIMICLRVNLPQPLIFCFGAWQDRSQCLCLETSLLLSKHP